MNSPEDMVNVRYMVDDVQAAVDFYTSHLGFTLRFSAAPAFADVTRGNLRLLLAGPQSSAGRRRFKRGRQIRRTPNVRKSSCLRTGRRPDRAPGVLPGWARGVRRRVAGMRGGPRPVGADRLPGAAGGRGGRAHAHLSGVCAVGVPGTSAGDRGRGAGWRRRGGSWQWRSEEHTSEL